MWEKYVLFIDGEAIVIDKPAGLVVHPGAGNPAGTLVNALLHRDPSLELLPRAGIVHRLDKDTSGVMVVARTLPAHTSLVAQLSAREVHRQYLAIVVGALVAGGAHPRFLRNNGTGEPPADAVGLVPVLHRVRGGTLTLPITEDHKLFPRAG